MHSPFFSIVIPTLDEEKYLPKLLRDLHSQTYLDFEIHIVDGNSKDKTQEIARLRLRDTLAQFLHVSEKSNVSIQRNLGAQQSKGKYLLFLDADSRIPRYFLEGLHYQLLKKPYDVWTTWAKPDGNDPRDILTVHTMNLMYEAGKTAGLPMAVGACLGCKRSLFQKIGGFDAEMSIGEDYDFVYRATRQGFSFHMYRDPQYIYSFRRIHYNGRFSSLTNTSYTLLILQALLRNQKITDPNIYPMLGGSFFTKKKTNGSVTYMLTTQAKKFQKLLQKNQSRFERTLKEIFG